MYLVITQNAETTIKDYLKNIAPDPMTLDIVEQFAAQENKATNAGAFDEDGLMFCGYDFDGSEIDTHAYRVMFVADSYATGKIRIGDKDYSMNAYTNDGYCIISSGYVCKMVDSAGSEQTLPVIIAIANSRDYPGNTIKLSGMTGFMCGVAF